MKRASLAIISALMFAAPAAQAADMALKALPPALPVWDWTGFYIGANLGGHWGTDGLSTTTDPLGWTPADATKIDAASPITLHPQGAIGGLQAGYNWRVNNFLLGLEADADWAGGSASRLLPGGGFGSANFMTDSVKETFLSTIRGRAGVIVDRALFYATGGLAIGRVNTNDLYASFAGTQIASVTASTTRTGWTAGGGIEYAVTTNWSLKAEYLHADLGTVNTMIPSCTICAIGSDITVHHRYSDDSVGFGVNLKLGSLYK